MYLQTVMLLLRAEGLHSCPQMAWSKVRETVAEVLSPSDGLILFCGMSIGYEGPTVSYARTGRAPLNETSRSSAVSTLFRMKPKPPEHAASKICEVMGGFAGPANLRDFN